MDPRDLPDDDLKSPLDAVLWFLQVLASNPDLTPMALTQMLFEGSEAQWAESVDYIRTFEAAIGTAPADPIERAEFWAELEAKMGDEFAREMLDGLSTIHPFVASVYGADG